MASGRYILTRLLFFFLTTGLVAASDFISHDVLDSHRTSGRSLLDAVKSCPVNFELMNYKIITSQCKGPKYPAHLCCKAFKDFACPYTEELNDLSNDCASAMFYYINFYGKYRPGLFANKCREGENGLECPA
ncbi:GPI-anchored protein LLG1-like [Magnolia sinica]|uniref:GPI-anchored protein LLG1-like n=1 Tax=Magnolia sinica TaxID=86752 RepID=UPI00265B71C6|nr:GPI-anchored protein LLG1-like [Magnolia sinica]